ncbi:maltose ABC transporter substrate-binding protein [Collibacillus ludicampi]|uniref:Maltose ABC transporter substrate-binding protein n=1 Tax=Collibacillus ludicampi TaxID=2771369 RepID=A0AAV4LH14_9BACL|nr:sugar ABC transporter substrate-binding protein [Collibacillus ludicampi]GIM46722.1 maltose ABC transporter substrate-binding protein [Collibacillus ludicampi]
MKMKKRWLNVLSALTLTTLALTGCGSSGSSANNAAPANGGGSGGDGGKGSITIATVNNPDMMIMKKLSPEFEKETGIKVNWVVLPENDLRKKVTEDVALGAGKFDIVTVGMYDTPIWAKNKWLEPLTPYLDKMSADEKAKYDLNDIFPALRDALSYNNQLYAAPFNAESSILYYNKDMLAKAGVTMPENPTWDQVAEIAKKVKAANNVPGIVLRGLPGWGEILAPLDTVINAFGGSWYDMNWNAKLNSPETVKAVKFYVDLLKEAGEPGATSTGFTEALTLMQQGKAAMWYDATTAAGFLNDPKNSKVAGKIGYALAPKEVKDNNGWLWSWALGMESSSKHKEEAFKFITWATSKQYIEEVGEKEGWVVAPAGTRKSTYENPKYKQAAPFADITLQSMEHADYKHPTKDPVPYQGIQYVAIPEFQQLGTEVSQEIAAAIAGQKTVEDAMNTAQQKAEKVAQEGGYKK